MMKAWQVQSSDGEFQEVVFAETSGKAKMKSEARSWCDFIDIQARRVPIFDTYATLGKVPKQAFLENGWWFECFQCHTYVDSDHNAKVSEQDDVFCEACFKAQVK